jgi:hypothetical protein
MNLDYDETIADLEELVSHFLFEYNGKNCGIDPISRNEYHLWYGDHSKIVYSIEEVAQSRIWDGNILSEIFEDIIAI